MSMSLEIMYQAAVQDGYTGSFDEWKNELRAALKTEPSAVKIAGIATAYGAAVRGGYTGSYDDFCDYLYRITQSIETVEAAADAAQDSAGDAGASAEQAAASAELAQRFVGAPRTANSAADMTDQSLIYVYTGTTTGSMTNGHWYYYNGTDWTDGGAYNSTAFSPDTAPTEGSSNVVTSGGVWAADEAIRGDVADLKSALEDLGEVVVSFTLGILQSNGTYNRTNTSRLLSQFIEFGNHNALKVKIPTGYQINRASYNSNGEHVGSNKYYVAGEQNITVDAGGTKVLLNIINLNSSSADMSWLDDFEFRWFDILTENSIDSTLSIAGKAADSKATGDRLNNADSHISELYDTVKIPYINWTIGIINSDGSYNRTNPSRLLSSFVGLENNEVLNMVIPQGYQVLVGWYDSNGEPISSSQREYFTAGNRKVQAKTGSTQVLLMVINLNSSSANMSWLDDFNFYWDSLVFESTINQIKTIGNVLYGKKLVACGDSFTHGDWSGWVDPDGHSGTDSPYIYDSEWHMYKTYPYWIAKRNNMTLVNEAINGSTMSTGENGANIPNRYPFSYTRYQNLPSDADYILLWFGLNDINNSPKGTITDGTRPDDPDDPGNKTFYGAWNIVLPYLIEHHPLAKIGIVATDSYDTFNDAVRAIGIKWGIPVLDLMGDKNVPLMIGGRSSDLALSSTAKTLRNNTFLLANGHPNLDAHIYQSTFIEQFLRSL